MAKIIKYFPFGGADSGTNGTGPWYTRISNQSSYTDVGKVWGLWESSAWDPTPTVSLVFLAKVSAPTGYVALFNKTDNIQLSEDVQVSSTTWQPHESASITMPAGDLKEFIVRGKKSAGDIDIVPLGLRIIQNATTINKTVTYIPLAFQDPAGTGGINYGDPRGPIHYYHEAGKFDGTLSIVFEAILEKAGQSSTAYAALTKTDDTEITSVSATTISRQRSTSISLSDLISYKARYKASSAMYPGAILYQALIIIKQTGGVQKTKIHVALDGGWEALDGTKNTYAEGQPNSHDWDPGDISDVAAVYFEFMGKDPNNYGVYAKLRNYTDNSDINGASIVIQNSSAWGRARSGDIYSALPSVSKEFRSHRKHGSASGSSSIGNRFLIIEQSWVTTYTVKDAFESLVEIVQETKDAFGSQIAWDYNQAKDAFGSLIETIDTWTRDTFGSSIGTVAEEKDAFASQVATVQEVKDAFGSDIRLLDETGPYIVAGTLSPAPGAKGVLASDKIKFSIADNAKVKLSSIKCKLTPYQLDDAGGKIYKTPATYDYNSPEWSHADVYGDGRRYDVEIDPPDFPEGHFIEREITADDEQGNPGLTVA